MLKFSVPVVFPNIFKNTARIKTVSKNTNVLTVTVSFPKSRHLIVTAKAILNVPFAEKALSYGTSMILICISNAMIKNVTIL